MTNPFSRFPFRKWLLAGLLVVVPLAITIWVLRWIITTLDQLLWILPTSWQPDSLLGIHIPGLGVIMALLVLLFLGALASNFIGRRLLTWWNQLLHRIPVVNSVYSAVKQVSDTLFSDSGNAFRKAVLVQWPRPGVWTVAFVTGSPADEVAHHLGEDYLNVYVPTTPNPTGGYFVMLPKSECIELRMNVDEALKHIISMGVVSPASRLDSSNNLPLD